MWRYTICSESPSKDFSFLNLFSYNWQRKPQLTVKHFFSEFQILMNASSVSMTAQRCQLARTLSEIMDAFVMMAIMGMDMSALVRISYLWLLLLVVYLISLNSVPSAPTDCNEGELVCGNANFKCEVEGDRHVCKCGNRGTCTGTAQPWMLTALFSPTPYSHNPLLFRCIPDKVPLKTITEGATADQSSYYSTAIEARLLLDGKSQVRFSQSGNCAHTQSEQRPWMRIDLGSSKLVGSIELWMRGDPSHIDRQYLLI